MPRTASPYGLSFAVMTLALGTLAQVARAENRPTLLAEPQDAAPPATVELEAGWWFDSTDSSTIQSLQFTLSGSYRPSEHADLELDLPFAFASVSPDSDSAGEGISAFRAGNPFAA